MITKEKFLDYEAIRKSGVTNMFDLQVVVSLSDNLTREDCIEIIKNYEELKEKYVPQKD